MISTLDVAEAQEEMCDEPLIDDLVDLLHRMSRHYMLEDREMFPSDLNSPKEARIKRMKTSGTWSVFATRLYTELARLQGAEDDATRAGYDRLLERAVPSLEEWAPSGRHGTHLIHPIYHDALVLGARWTGDGVRLEPLLGPELWAAEQTVNTPLGDLRIKVETDGARTRLRFEADAGFPVEINHNGWTGRTTSKGELDLEG